MKCIYKIFIFLVSFVLTGCFENENNISFDRANFTFVGVIKQEKNLLGLYPIPCNNYNPQLNNISGLIEIVKSEDYENDNLICTIYIQGPIKIFDNIDEDNFDMGIGRLNLKRNNDFIKMKFIVGELKEKNEKTSSSAVGSSLTKSAFENKNIIWNLTALEIISTNGKLSNDGKNAFWIVKISDVLDAPKEFTATFRYKPNSIERFFYKPVEQLRGHTFNLTSYVDKLLAILAEWWKLMLGILVAFLFLNLFSKD